MKNYTPLRSLRLGKNNASLLPLFLLVSFHVVANVIWIFLNDAPPVWDAAQHSVISARFYHYLTSSAGFDPAAFWRITPYYPPFVHLVGTLFVGIGEYSFKTIQLTGTIFLSLSLIFIYLLARELFHNKWAALLSAAFFSVFITIGQWSRSHMTDLPLIALEFAGFYFLVRSRFFRRTRYSLLFFLTLGFSLLTRWTSVIDYLVPLIYIFFAARKETVNWLKWVLNITSGIVIVAALALPWYLTNIDVIAGLAKVAATPELDDPQTLFSPDNLFFYPKMVIMFVLSFPGFVFFLICAFLMLKHERKLSALVLGQVIFTYLFFTFFVGNKNVRFLMTAMPFYALVMGYGAVRLAALKPRLLSRGGIILMLIHFFTSFTILSFGFPVYPRYKYTYQFPLIGWTDVLYLDTYPVRLLFDTTSWPNDLIAEELLALRRDRSYRVMYFIDSDKAYLNASTVHLALYESYNGVPDRLQETDTNFNLLLRGKARFPNDKALSGYVDQMDFAAIPLKDIGPEYALRDYQARKQIQEYFLRGDAEGFVLYRRIKLPDGDTLLLYKKS